MEKFNEIPTRYTKSNLDDVKEAGQFLAHAEVGISQQKKVIEVIIFSFF